MIRVVAIGLGAWIAASGAVAQDRARAAKVAAVNASGHIVVVPADVEPSTGNKVAGPCDGRTALPIDEARALVTKVATAEDFYPEFVLSVAKAESRFDSTALSLRGAYGLMQLMPETAQRYGVDLCDPAANVLGGVRLLRALHAKYRNPLFILAAYNAGEDAVLKSRGVPPFPETVRYVAQVLNDFYDWPPAGAARANGPSTDRNPDLIEPDKPAAAAPVPAKTRWDDGFVMHID